MNQQDAEKVYLHHVDRTNDLVSSMGDNPQSINTFITNTYCTLSQQHPIFLWFSLGTLVSNKVGQNIQFATQGEMKSIEILESPKIVVKEIKPRVYH